MANLITNSVSPVNDEKNFIVNVLFEQMETCKRVVQKIKSLGSAQLVLWYISPYGLRDSGACFYKKNFFHFQQLPQATFNLWDLTAWAALKNRSKSYESHSPHVDTINSFNLKQVKSLKSSAFFKWVFTEADEHIKNYVQSTILKRNEIFSVSKDRTDIGLKIRNIVNVHDHMLSSIADEDCTKIYSPLQYLEAIYLVMQIVEEQFQKSPINQEINIAFVLPNDENKYYCQENPKVIQEDMEKILKFKFGEQLNKISLNVSFFPFAYRHVECRPYLEGKVIKEIAKDLILKEKV